MNDLLQKTKTMEWRPCLVLRNKLERLKTIENTNWYDHEKSSHSSMPNKLLGRLGLKKPSKKVETVFYRIFGTWNRTLHLSFATKGTD